MLTPDFANTLIQKQCVMPVPSHDNDENIPADTSVAGARMAIIGTGMLVEGHISFPGE